MVFKKIKCFLIMALALSGCTDDDIDKPIDADGLTLRLEQILMGSDFPGFTIGIVKNGKASYQMSFGFQNIEDDVRYTNRTLQPIASISKTFLGVATVKAVELGFFELETPINDILTDDLINPKNPSAEIRIKHLVNHTSGLLDDEDTYASTYYLLGGQSNYIKGAQILQGYGIVERAPKSLSELLDSYYYEGGDYYSPDNFADSLPGDVENYSNVASSLMARLIEISSGLRYQDFLKTHIFDVLKMNDTSFEANLSNEKNAVLYFDKNTPLPFYGLESFPDGALKSSNEDLMKYTLNMTAGSRGKTNGLLTESSYKLLFAGTSSTYSVFWDIDPGDNAFGHSGGDPGVTTELHFNGSANAGFFVLSNYDSTTEEHDEHYEEVFSQINEVIKRFLSNPS